MKRMILIAGALLAIAGTAAGTYAFAAASSTQTINACVGEDGKLSVSASGDCKKNEKPLSWNTFGPQGVQGSPGLQGVAGPQGPAGRDGRDATSSSPDAATATITVTGARQGTFTNDPIDVIAVSHEIVSARDASSGLATGKRQHKPFSITKQVDNSSPLFVAALTSNENLPTVQIVLTKDGTTLETFKLTNASLATYNLHGNTETFTFTYRKITWTSGDGTKTAQDDWETPVA